MQVDATCVKDAENTVNKALQANINLFGTGELKSELRHLVVWECLCQVDAQGSLSTDDGRRHRGCANSLLIHYAPRTVS